MGIRNLDLLAGDDPSYVAYANPAVQHIREDCKELDGFRENDYHLASQEEKATLPICATCRTE